MSEQKLAKKYAELLAAKQKAILYPDDEGHQWKYNELNTLYHDSLIKAKLPKNTLNNVEKQGEALFEQYEKEQEASKLYKETYKNNVLQDLKWTREAQNYKQSYKQEILSYLDKDPVEKEPTAKEQQEIEKRNAEMVEFESKYGFGKVYELKNQVLEEISDMDLTSIQRERLQEVKENLEKEKQVKLEKGKKKDNNVEMEM